MAGSTIKGLTIEIGADTQKFSKAVKDLDAQARTIAKDLKTVGESLKIDPGNAEAFADKMKLLKEAVSNATTKVDAIKQAISKLNRQFEDSKAKQDLYKQSVSELDQALKTGKISQENYERVLKDVEEMYGKGLMTQKEYESTLKTLERQLQSATYEQNRSVDALDQYQRESSQAANEVDKLGDEQKETNKELQKFPGITQEASNGAFTLADAIKSHLTAELVLAGLRKLKDLALEIARALINAGKELYNFSKDAVELAAQYQDAVETSKRAFKEFAADAVEFAETQSVAFGLYKGDLLEAINSLGLMFSSMGLGRKEALEMSEQIVILAADIRAAFGGDMGEILDALSRGFSTSTRNLRQFGVYISEAEIKAYALSNGIVQTTVDQTKLNRALIDCEKAEKEVAKAIAEHGEESLEARDAEQKLIEKTEKLEKIMKGTADSMTTAQRETALLGLTQERLSDIQGQANAESEKYPALVNRIQAALKNLKETIGEELLPVFETLLKEFLDFIQSDEGKRVIGEIVEQFKKWADTLTEMVESGTVKEFFSSMSERLPELIDGTGDFVNKIIELLPNLEALVEKLMSLFGLKTKSEELKDAFEAASAGVEDLANKYRLNLDEAAKAINLFAEQNGFDIKEIYDNWEFYSPLIEGFLLTMYSNYSEKFSNSLEAIEKFAADNKVELSDIFGDWEKYEPQIAEYLSNLEGEYNTNTDEIYTELTKFAVDHGLSLQEVVRYWNMYKPEIVEKYTEIKDETEGLATKVDEEISKLPTTVQNGINNIEYTDISPLERLKSRISQVVDAISRKFDEIFGHDWEIDPSLIDQSTPDWLYGEGAWNPYSYASGGYTPAGRLLQVNDDAGHRPEIFIPSVPGTILNGNKTEQILNNVNNSRTVGDLYIQVYTQSNTMTGTGEELGEAVLKKLRMSGVML